MASKRELKHGTEVGERIRAYRLSQDMTQQDLADLVSVNRAYLAEIERCVKEPSYNFLMKLFASTSLSSNWLLAGEGSMFLLPPEEKSFRVSQPSLREAQDEIATEIAAILPGLDEQGKQAVLAAARQADRIVQLEKKHVG